MISVKYYLDLEQGDTMLKVWEQRNEGEIKYCTVKYGTLGRPDIVSAGGGG